jgi:hypothetical protein
MTLFKSSMNPDKLFDYLDGRLPQTERAALEEKLISEPQLQRELAVARRIHSAMRGDSQEIVLPAQEDMTERGRKMAFRVGAAFIVLMVVNVGFGLWLIARHEIGNPNRAFLEAQTRKQITESLERAATRELTPSPSLGVSEIPIMAAPGRLSFVADQIVALARRLGGSATKGLPDDHGIEVLVDLPSNRESEFRDAIAPISGGLPASATPPTAAELGSTIPATTASPAAVVKKSFVVQITEAPAKSN